MFQDTTARHVMVMRNGYFYKVDVLDDSGNILPASILFARLKSILNDDASSSLNPYPVGIFTCENRDKWADIRSHMNSIQGNKEAFGLIDSALFNLVLDEDEIADDPKKIVRHYLHGTGKNRYIFYS